MPCTTLIIGKKASYDGSTIIARNDDGGYTTKKLILVEPKDQPKKYKSKISHVEIELPKNPMRYTCTPNVDTSKNGIWAAQGFNEANVGMSATETITTNALVMGADPYIVYKKKQGKEKEVIGGIGEEDIVTITLPYIKSARDGVLRLGSLLEKYGTYESNGVIFNDANECWYMETIGGHHWMARRCKDDEVIIMPNQLGIDTFDLNDAYGKQKENLCSKDLKEFIEKNHLNLNKKEFNPRYIFGSHDDGDHIYNTCRSWYIGKLLCPNTYKWTGDNADFTPESDNIPWSLTPEKKLTIEDVKYILSTHYQGTKFDVYQKAEYPEKGKYRTIGTATTDTLSVLQCRGYMPKQLQCIHWVAFASNPFNTLCPVYPMGKIQAYLKDVKDEVDTDTFFWNSRLMGALCDGHFGDTNIQIDRYQNAVANKSHEIINKYDSLMMKKKKYDELDKANKEISDMVQKETSKALYEVLKISVAKMKNRFFRGDN